MSAVLDILAGLAVMLGLFFYLAGTVGVLRFPDLHTRLHAVSKADNLGLGLVVLGLLLLRPEWTTGFKYLLAWGLMMLASASSSHLISRAALRAGVKPWRRGE